MTNTKEKKLSLKTIELKQTCEFCPSQWEAKLKNGKMLYIRYRHGYLTVRTSIKKTNDIFDAVRGDYLFSKVIGDSLGGTMDTEEMLKITGLSVEGEK